MQVSNRDFCGLVALMAVLCVGCAGSVFAGEYYVPTDFPTIQEAVAAAAVSADPENFVTLTAPQVFTTEEIFIGSDFYCTHTLMIRPSATLGRATIASSNGAEPIITMQDAGCVTFQDLDIVRCTTNQNHLIHLRYEGLGNNDIVFERCRIGSIWEAPGSSGWCYLVIWHPYNVIVRNCIFFSVFPGDFDKGIFVTGLFEPEHALRLYNNVVADYRLKGIEIGATNGLILLRNNVVVNHPDIPPGSEPYAYSSSITLPTPIIVTSHNVAFASAGREEELVGAARTIAGRPGPAGDYFIRFDRVEVDDAFISRTWVTDPPWDPNEDFFDLDWQGILHEEDSWGVTVTDSAPYSGDIAVVDDIDREVRPSGVPEHTDRSADQVDAVIAGVRCPFTDTLLWARHETNPCNAVQILFRARVGGRLRLEVYDVGGRCLHTSEQAVSAGQSGRLLWPGPAMPGVVFYRLTLVSDESGSAEVQGKVVLVR